MFEILYCSVFKTPGVEALVAKTVGGHGGPRGSHERPRGPRETDTEPAELPPVY